MDIEAQLKKILAIALQKDISEIHTEVISTDVQEWDSLQQMNIIVALEEEFSIRFNETESILLNSYSSLLEAVRGRVEG